MPISINVNEIFKVVNFIIISKKGGLVWLSL
jgi:hypothetical protein